MCMHSLSIILAYLSSTRSNELEGEFAPSFWLLVVFLAGWPPVLDLPLDLFLRGGSEIVGGLAGGVSGSRYLCGRRVRRGRSRGGESRISSPSTTCDCSAVRFIEVEL